MSNDKLREDILKEAVRIGDNLLARAKKDDDGTCWETMTMDLEQNIGWQVSEGIYSGVSGIALFLLELHKRTGDPKYMAASVDGMHWVTAHCRKNQAPYFAFFTGRMGVPYALLKMTEATGDRSWTEKALEIARPCIDFVESPGGIDDLINGSSGTVISLLHLHAATNEKWVLDAVDAYVEHLVHNAHHGPKGLYWDRSPKNISGLCGFSHGAAGIGWMFMELGRYFNNPSFYHLARQAFLYESCHYDAGQGNWQDLRKGIYNDEDEQKHRKAYLDNDMEFFTVGGDMNAWCHGAAGIGLSRLRAMELFKEISQNDLQKLYETHTLQAVEKTTATDIERENPVPSFILCHGGGGNAEIFLEAYRIFKDKKYLALAEKVAQQALDFHKKNNRYICGYRAAKTEEEDTSLFMGNSGIGYFYLRVLAPHDVPSILIPTLNSKARGDSCDAYPTLTLSLPDTGRELLKKYFQRTLVMAEKFLPRELEAFLDTAPSEFEKTPLKDAFTDFIEKNLSALPPKEQTCLNDVFILEREKVKIDDAVQGHSRLEIKRKVLSEKAEEFNALDNEAFLKLKFTLEPDTRIATTDWDWGFSNQEGWLNNINLEADIYPLLIKPGPYQVMEEPLSPLSYTILGSFSGERTVEDVRKETIDAFESLTPDQEKMLTEKIIEQIKQALLAGILIG